MDTANSTHATPGQMVSKPTLLLKPMPLKNTLESGVIENHASSICFGLGKRGKRFIPPGIRILWQKSKWRKLLICQNTMDFLCESGAKLKKSHKGKDPKLGLPAKGFLSTVLSKANAVLWVDPKNKTGNYGRLLAVLEVKGHNINLALIKRGHS